MGKIVNRNCDGMCCEICCNQEPTHYQEMTKHGIEIILPFCKQHNEDYENFNNIFKKVGKVE